ncbi:MAG: hypothetical protein PHS54_01185 [Clostridia bacterium]|nr:hypothetical protein [Clostridia bacterium]
MVTRAEIEQAKQDVQKAQEQIQTSRGNIASTQEQVQQARGTLRRPKRVPFTPRKERLARSQYRRKLSGVEGELTSAEKQLAAQEAEIQKYQTEVLNPADAELRKIEEYNNAVETIEKAAAKGMVWAHAFYGEGLVQELAQRYLKLEKAQKDLFRKRVAEFQNQNPNEKLLVDWKNMKITGVESGTLGQSLSLDNYNKRIEEINKSLGDYKPLATNLPAYYDPLSGKEVLQSIDPNIAKGLGYVPMELQAYDKNTGKYIAESKTGLLTPSQMAYKNLLDSIQQQRTQIPTTFEIGGTPSKMDPLAIFGPQTPYESAVRSSPYAGKELNKVEFQRLGPEGFYNKYGRDVDPQGVFLLSGTGSGMINLGPTRKEGKSIAAWYGRTIIDPESAKSALNLALLGTGAKAVTAAIQGSRAAIKSIARTGGTLFSDQITQTASNIVDSIIPQSPTGFQLSGAPSQVGRGVLYYALGSNPVVAPAFITAIAKSAVVDPIGTARQIKDYVIENPYEVATLGGLSKAELRLRQRIARSKMYYEVIDKLEFQYGSKAPEVTQFKTAWKRAFNELPKRTDIVQKWTSKDLEAVAGDKKLTRILDEINSKYKPEVIGSTTITPQTSLKELPRGKAGDIDVQNVPALLKNKSRQMAQEIYARLQAEGYNVRMQEGDFFGNPKYHITLNGKELINIGTDTNYFLKTQLGPLRDLFEFERIGQFTTDPVTGVRLGGIRGQLRVKLAKGYGEGSTGRIRELKQLMKEGKLVGREKDIIDALGIVEGTNYLFEGGRYIGPRSRLGVRDIYGGIRGGVVDSVRGKLNSMNNLLTGRGGTGEYGYYEKIPTKQRKAYAQPKDYYKKPSYDPANYLIPKKAAPYKKGPTYKKPVYTPTSYLVPEYPTPKKTPYKGKTPYKRTPYTPTNYLVPQYGPPKKTPYKPPVIKKNPPVEELLTRRFIEKERPKKGKKKKQRKPRYKTLPTLSQQIIGYRLGKTVQRVTGFEIARV